MKIQETFRETVLVEDIPEGGLHRAYDDMPGLFADTDDCKAVSTVAGTAFLQKIRGGVYLQGEVAAEIGLICDRCLTDFNRNIRIKFSYILLGRPVSEIKEQIELKDEDMEISFFDGIEVPLADLFREQILLQIPMKHLCREDCRGLCPICGADLNREKCACHSRKPENPFAVLKKISVSGKQPIK